MAEAKDLSETKQELSLVCQSEIVYFNPGDDVVLSCHLKPAISAASMEIMWWNKEDLVFHYKDGWVKVGYDGRVNLSLEDIRNGNVSLTLRDVRRSQKGLCICEVIHECQTLQDTVFLHISSEDFSLVIPNGTVSADPGSDVILPAHLSPETSAVSMTVRWFRETELIYQYMNGQEKTNDSYEHRLSLSIQELERGNLSLTLRNFQQSDSGKYTCKVFHDGCLQTGIVHLQVKEIQKCDKARLRHLHSVLKQVQDDIMIQKVQLLTGTLSLLQETLSQDGSFVEDDGMHEPRTMAGETLRRLFGQNIIYITDRMRSPNLERHHHDQNTRQTREGNTATQQELFSPNIPTPNGQNGIKSEGARIQTDQERRQESKSTEQRRSSLQEQESQRTSQSASLLPGDTTQTPDRPEDRMPRTQRRRQSTNTNCQVT